MAELGPVAWPPAAIRTERLVLREPEARDRAAFIELFASPEVGTYLGGPRPLAELERSVPAVPGRRPGLFVVDLDGAMIGLVTFDRRGAERPGHLRPAAGEADLGYLFLPKAWGLGYAAEACAAALDWWNGSTSTAVVRHYALLNRVGHASLRILAGMRMRSLLLAASLLLGVAGCGGGDNAGPGAVAFTKVDLPGGAEPVVLAVSGDALLIGLRRDGPALVPGLLRRAADGTTTELALHPATPYGRLARWYSIASDGQQIVALGGARGGAHGNVRWSAWTGSASGLSEQEQAFNTFGGNSAGDMIDAVLTGAGPVLVGTRASDNTGLDAAVWTHSGDSWNRQSSAGTPLESRRDSINFPIAATALGPGELITGFQLNAAGPSRQPPVVWRSTSPAGGWTVTALPEPGQAGAGMAVRCWDARCSVAGRVDGKFALWRLDGDSWARVPGLPTIPVGDKDRLAPPVEPDGRLTAIVSDSGQVKLVRADGVRAASGPTGTVTATAQTGNTIFVLAGPDEDHLTLWQAPKSAL